jgi:hypothetical protein
MTSKKTLIALVLALALLGCGKRQPKDIIIMLDVSASIDRESLAQGLRAIDGLASRLQRGDKLTIIPILGDAQAEASGQIMRFDMPRDRQAYDADLRSFRTKLNTTLREMQFRTAMHPGSRTDILGSVELATQELQIDVVGRQHILVILSDFIQEDGAANFRTSERIRDSGEAKIFSQQLAQRDGLCLGGATVYLGLLRSNEYKGLSEKRKSAIRSFWMRYFVLAGSRPKFVVDGPGLLDAVLKV